MNNQPVKGVLAALTHICMEEYKRHERRLSLRVMKCQNNLGHIRKDRMWYTIYIEIYKEDTYVANMKTKWYLNNENIVAGITLRDECEPECNNMALHACVHPDEIIDNRKKLAALLHCSLDDFVCCNQTHSSHFHRVTLSDRGRGAVGLDSAINDTDALYTYEPNLLLCCFTADCVPTVFYNQATGLIGVIHSGWQGTVKEITMKLLEHIIRFEHCNPDDLKVHIGMALSQDRFEVDNDVYVNFKALGYANDFIDYDENTGKYYIDNQQIVKLQWKRMGIRPDQITMDRTCTYSNSEGFSYRRDKKCGRHMSFIIRIEK